MCEAEYLAKLIREWPRVRGTVCKLATRMLEQEAKLLGEKILNDLTMPWDLTSKEDGFGNDYVAMCYQTHYRKFKTYENTVKRIESLASEYKLPYVLRKLYEDKDEVIDPETRKYMDAELTLWYVCRLISVSSGAPLNLT